MNQTVWPVIVRVYEPLPLSTTSSVYAFGVSNGRGNPFTIFLIIPFFRLGGIFKNSYKP
jgi:hypothetical protein